MFEMYGILRFCRQILRKVLLFMINFIFFKEDLDIKNKDNYADFKNAPEKGKGKTLRILDIFVLYLLSRFIHLSLFKLRNRVVMKYLSPHF